MSRDESTDLTEELLSWAGVTKHPHRFGGGESERDRWIQERKTSPHHMYPDSGWVSVYLITDQDTAFAIEIARSKKEQIQRKGEMKHD